METSAQVQKINDLFRELIDTIPKQGTVQEIHYKSEGMGIVGVICATICVMTLLITILAAIFISSMTLHDLNAWVGQHL